MTTSDAEAPLPSLENLIKRIQACREELRNLSALAKMRRKLDAANKASQERKDLEGEST